MRTQSATPADRSAPPLGAVAAAVLERLGAIDDPRARATASALHEVLFDGASPDEAAWVRRIESLRARLEGTTTPISIALPFPGARDRQRPVGEICRRRSKRPLWGLLLLKLVRKLAPASVLELGTCLGISTAYQTAGLHLNRRGALVTLEGAPALAALAAENLRGLRLDRARVRPGLFQDTLPAVLEEVAPLDFAFIDGHHDEQATLSYFERILPFLSPSATLVFDDIAWSEGMASAWAALRADPRTGLSVDLTSVGIAMPGAGPAGTGFALPPLSRIQAAEQVPRILDRARGVVPSGATVLVVSRGDDELLALDGRRAWHFPQVSDGSYAGHHPADSREAIVELERLRERGAEYLLFPSTAYWWLEFYAGFREHLELNARCLCHDDECAVYALSPLP